jgi:propanol-preferring alcohol dehydrogenase
VIANERFAAKLPNNIDYARMAPILCAGVTTHKGLKETEARPGEWVAISGVGLGHLAIQYAKALGLQVAALDVVADKLALAKATGADVAVDARSPEAAAEIVRASGGGAHGVLVPAVSPAAFSHALNMVRRKGTVALVGLPPGAFPTPIFDVVLKRITIRGSIVGTRQDLDEAIAFAAEGKVSAHVETTTLECINTVLSELKAGQIEARMVLDLAVEHDRQSRRASRTNADPERRTAIA